MELFDLQKNTMTYSQEQANAVLIWLMSQVAVSPLSKTDVSGSGKRR